MFGSASYGYRSLGPWEFSAGWRSFSTKRLTKMAVTQFNANSDVCIVDLCEMHYERIEALRGFFQETKLFFLSPSDGFCFTKALRSIEPVTLRLVEEL